MDMELRLGNEGPDGPCGSAHERQEVTDAAKSDLRYPIARRLIVVFAVVLLIGIAMQIIHRTDLSDLVVFIGAVGLLGSGLIATEKKP